jgi:hydrogenase expression/formation protein HypC
MCLGIPGQITSLHPDNPHLASAEVAGVTRTINVGLVVDDGIVTGDWVLIHVGFAMSKIDEAEAARALDGLRLLGAGFDDELEGFGRAGNPADPVTPRGQP